MHKLSAAVRMSEFALLTIKSSGSPELSPGQMSRSRTGVGDIFAEIPGCPVTGSQLSCALFRLAIHCWKVRAPWVIA